MRTCFKYLEVFHKHGDDNVDENELSHEDENNEEDRGNDTTDAAVFNTIIGWVAVFTQGVLHVSQHISAVRGHHQTNATQFSRNSKATDIFWKKQ